MTLHQLPRSPLTIPHDIEWGFDTIHNSDKHLANFLATCNSYESMQDTHGNILKNMRPYSYSDLGTQISCMGYP